MATATITPQISSTGSHSVTDSAGSSLREEVFLYFTAEWRGSPCVVGVACKRYCGYDSARPSMTHSPAGLGTWSMYVQEARGGTPYGDDYVKGDSLTDTAKHRLAQYVLPMARDWLTTQAYRDSEHRAYLKHILRHVEDMKASIYSDAAQREYPARKAIANFGGKLSDGDLVRIESALSAYTEFAAALSAAYGSDES